MRYNLLEQFDHDNEYGLLRPEYAIQPSTEAFPDTVVAEFSKQMVENIAEKYHGTVINYFITVSGNIPIYKILYKGKHLAIYNTMIGAPASASCLEEVIQMGARKIMFCGECGVLRKDIADGKIIIPEIAVRDEGTSYHYWPSSDEIEMDHHCVEIIEQTLNEEGVPYIKGKIWTTDASYRETVPKIAMRKKSGCIAVDMECSAMIAVSRLRRVKFGQIVYACDNLDADVWDRRGLTIRPIKQKEDFFEIAMDCAVRL